MSFFKNSLVMIFGSFFINFLQACQGIIIARVLGPGGTGQFQLAITIGIIATSIFAFGIGKANVFMLNNRNEDSRNVVSNSIGFSMICGLFTAICIYLILTFGKKYTGYFCPWVILVFSISQIFFLLQLIVGPILIAQMEVLAYNISQISGRMAGLILIGIFCLLELLTTERALLLATAYQFLAAFIILYFLREHICLPLKPKFILLRKTIKYGLQLYSVNLLLLLDQNIAMILIGIIMPGEFEALGYFSRAVAICALIRLAPLSLSNLLYSLWSGSGEEKSVRQAEKILKIYLLLSFLILLVIFFLGKYIIILLYGQAFLPAYNILQILALQQIFWMFGNVFQSLFSGSGKPMLTTYSLIISNTLSIFGMIFFIPSMGIIAAAYSLAISQLINAFINIAFAKKYFDFKLLNCVLFKNDEIRLLFEVIWLKRVNKKISGQ